MSITRRYSSAWISRLPCPERAKFILNDASSPDGWVSSIETWTAYIQAAVETQDLALGFCARRFPIRALPAGLRIMSTASELSEAIYLMSSFGKLADLPWRLELRSEGETSHITFALDGDDQPVLADLEVQMAGFFMASLNWLAGKRLPFEAFKTRSKGFADHHKHHPDLGCEVLAANATGFSLPLSALNSQCSKERVEESVTETLLWLVYDRPEEMILPRQKAETIDADISKIKVADFPLFNDVGARQKRRNLISISGMTLRELKQKIILRRAKLLLLDQDKTLTDIAIELGYSDEGSFRRFFKKCAGLSPKEFCNSEEYNILKKISKISQLSLMNNV